MAKRNTLTLTVTLLLFIAGVFFTYQGFQPYTIRDMNGDGKIDWHDYDVNSDGRVDMRDIVKTTRAYGSSYGDADYNPRVDFNGDGVIDDYDLNAIKDYFGQGSLSLIGLIQYRLTTPKGLMVAVGMACLAAAIILAVKMKPR